MERNLKKKTIVGIAWSTFQRFGKLGMAFIANLVMARLLTPEDYGAIGILMIFISLSMVFIDAGFGNALIQKTKPTKEDYTTIFYFNIITAVIFSLILFFFAPLIAKFYEMDSLSDLLRVLSFVLIINSLSIIQDCKLRKELNFKLLAIATLMSAFFGAVSGIYTAYIGYGVWSLVIYYFVETTIRSLLLWVFCRWYPSFIFSLDSLRELFRFGGFLLANSFLFTLRQSGIAMVIGKMYSASDLGYYSQAKKLQDVPVTAIRTVIGQVTFPLFATVKDNVNQLKTAQKKGNLLLAFICIPLMALFFVLAHDLIIGLYSEKWAGAIPYFQILCICGIFVSLQEVNANVINALGHSGLHFKWSIVKTVILFSLLYAGSFIGIRGLLLAWCIQNILAYLINAVLSGQFTSYSAWQQIKDLIPIIGISLLCVVILLLFSQFVQFNLWINIIIQTILFGTLYLFSFRFLRSDYLLVFFEAVKTIKK